MAKSRNEIAFEILEAIYAKKDIDTDDLQHFAPNSQAFLHACVAFENEKAARTLLRAGWSNFRCPAKDEPNSVLQIIPTTIDTRDVTLSTILALDPLMLTLSRLWLRN